MHRASLCRNILTLAAVGSLAACAAADTAINHSELTVQTHMSETVFLDPVPPQAKTVFVTARNTSDHPEIDLRQPLAAAIAARGYAVVADPNAAHYMLRVNVLQAGPIDPQSKGAILSAKYGEPLLAGATAAAVTGGLGGGAGATVGVGLGVAAGTYLANQLYKDVTYSVVVDIQLSERPLNGAKVRQSTTTVAHQTNGSADYALTSQVPGGVGTSSAATRNSRTKTQQVDEESNFKQYQIREVAYADKANLKFEDASGLLLTRLTGTLSNLFE
jgi:hypothetical protein